MTHSSRIALGAFIGCLSLARGEVLYTVLALNDKTGSGVSETFGGRITDSGLITGYSTPTGEVVTMFSYSPAAGFADLGSVSNKNTRGNGINERSQISGFGWGGDREIAFRYTPGVGYVDLGNLGGNDYNRAGIINATGQVVGMSGLADGSYHAFRYTDGVGMVDLGTLGGELSIASDINDLGWVVGTSRNAEGIYHAYFYKDESGMVDLGRGGAWVINNHGDIAGTVPGILGPVFFRDGAAVPVPCSLAGDFSVNDMNDYNRFVGSVSSLVVPVIAYLGTESNGLVNLNTLISPNAGWQVYRAFGINNHGQIAGSGVFNGQDMAYRLDPIPPKLAVRTAGTNAAVSWTPAWPGVVLESASTLTSTNWTPVPSQNTNSVTIPSDSPARFFRLNLEALRGLCCAP